MKSSWIIQGCPKPKDSPDNTTISDLQPLWLWDNKCLLFYTTKCVLVIAATWKEYTYLDRNSFVLVSSGCYNKRPQMVASTTDMASWRSRNQQIWFLETSLSWRADNCLLTLSWQREKDRGGKLSSISPYKSRNTLMRVPTLWPHLNLFFQETHLQILSYCQLRLSTWIGRWRQETQTFSP